MFYYFVALPYMAQIQAFSRYALPSLNLLEERMWFFTLSEFNCTPTHFTKWKVLNHTLSRLGFFFYFGLAVGLQLFLGGLRED